jgi:hypothetical protein
MHSKPLSYIKFIGQVKIFATKAHVVAHHVSKMQSFHELKNNLVKIK